MNKGIECPICGKYYFDDFIDYDNCSVCGWKINIIQYDDHDFSNGTNALSVNEFKLEYVLLCNEKTQAKAKELKDAFVEKCFGLRKMFRDSGTTRSGLSCEDIRTKEITAREEYVQQLRQLEKTL